MPARRRLALLLTLALGIALVPGVASAGAPGKWTRISSSDGVNTNRVGLHRTPGGILHAIWHRPAPSDATKHAYGHTAINPNGSIKTAPHVVNVGNGWGVLYRGPKIVDYRDGDLRLIFSGINGAGGSPYNSGAMYTATSTDAGATWNLNAGSMSKDTHAYSASGTDGMGAVAHPTGGPIASWAANLNEVLVHQGVDASNPAAANDIVTTHDACCTYDSELAIDANTDDVYVGWYSNSSTASMNGVFVRKVYPSTGAVMKAPGSSSSGDSVQPFQGVALTGRKGGAGVYLAYCAGYPTCGSIRLWKVGAAGTKKVPMSKGASRGWLAQGPGGRLWVMWSKQGTTNLFATRTNPAVTRFGAVRTIKAPKGTANVWSVAGEGSRKRLDLVTLLTKSGVEAFWHTQVLPGLSLTAKPRKFDNATGTTVIFTVTDAGKPVAGAVVKVAGKQGKTSKKGKVAIKFAAGFPTGTYKATARKGGYAPDTARIRIV